MTRPCRAALTAALLAALLGGCADGGGGSAAEGPAVAATTTQLGDLARAVAGSRADVSQILDANSDPHAYEPRPSDVRAVAEAKLVLRSGGDLDDWLADVLRNAGADARTITLADAVRARRAAARTIRTGGRTRATRAVAVTTIRDGLIAADPAGRAAYTGNAAAYLAKLRALDRRYRGVHGSGSRSAAAGSSPITTRSASTPRATASRSSAPRSPHARRRRRRRRARSSGSCARSARPA